MEKTRLGIADWLDVSFELLAQLVLVLIALAVGWWLWPEELLEASLAAIRLKDLLFAGLAVVACGFGALMIYFVLEPFVVAYRRR